MRWRRASLMGVGLGLVLSQLLVFQHARAMTTWASDGARTPPPEELDSWGKARVLLTGVRVPRPMPSRSPADLELPHELRPWTGPDEVPQEAWQIPPAPGSSPKGTVILWHGYAAACDQLLETASRLHQDGWTTVLANLGGSGDGGWDRTSLGLREAESVALLARELHEETGEEPALYGFSMGGAAILEALARHRTPARGAVVEATFARLRTTVQRRFRLMGLPGSPGAELLLFWGGVQAGFDPFDHNPEERAAEVGVPVMVVQGADDARVSPQDAHAIHDALPAGSALLLLDGVGHEQAAQVAPKRWDDAVLPWLDGLNG